MRDQTKPEQGDEPPDRERAWTLALKKLTNWTAPGQDGFWLKSFSKVASLLKEMFWEILDEEREAPEWLIRSRTVLLPKDGCNGEPDKFRPITCLNTSYKLLTGVLAKLLMQHVMEKGILPEEQKALRKGQRGCLDALLIDAAVTKEVKIYGRDLSMAWIDYRKAFDMVPHKWINQMLKAIRAPKWVRRTIRNLIPKWETEISLQTTEDTASFPIALKRGVFQGDSLSPLLFCLCIAPLSKVLNGEKGFTSQYQPRPITHLLFMDDLKIYAESQAELQILY